MKDKNWTLIFEDNFNLKGKFDERKWSFCERQRAPWNKYLASRPEYAYLDGANLVLTMDNKPLPGDSVPYNSGGVKTQSKFSFTYGKVEVRAKFTRGRGSWPAIWMMPEHSAYGGWPKSGEIDIMEHVNNENVVHHTVHNSVLTSASGGSQATKSVPYDTSGFNTYGMVWQPDSLQFYLNGVLQYTYRKPGNATTLEWPFDQPFYLILNQSGGAGWPGPITEKDLPFKMYVDWVKVYK